ncbi:hypothetical protein BLA18112_07465 [Burkholderia lata]|uniref:PHA-granule associated protein 4 n=1 Tax=Burkholderia lata (strain ATCC 17760 / DSM 23089 / LMG 22485 / NCIMB 9086 / R18194 / 383) TaxID=482957 RepID=A0A6P3AT95_BURL3|nr:PHA-granule associated protein 4 [Burkholderia lata]VWD50661.1 hypothetical protein BLA18112_07465 [Burkholderia lata]
MTSKQAHSRDEALRLIAAADTGSLDLNYENGWQDVAELDGLGARRGIRVTYRSHEHIAVHSHDALVAGLTRPKTTFRRRNLYCRFDLGSVADRELVALETRAMRQGDYILAGHLLASLDDVWGDAATPPAAARSIPPKG